MLRLAHITNDVIFSTPFTPQLSLYLIIEFDLVRSSEGDESFFYVFLSYYLSYFVGTLWDFV
jgi:hypothetical protein